MVFGKSAEDSHEEEIEEQFNVSRILMFMVSEFMLVYMLNNLAKDGQIFLSPAMKNLSLLGRRIVERRDGEGIGLVVGHCKDISEEN
jgi:hypothetical protein